MLFKDKVSSSDGKTFSVHRNDTQRMILRTVTLIFVVIFYVIPIIRLVIMSFNGEEGFTLQFYQDILQSERTWEVLKNTLIMLIGSVALSAFIGILFAWLVAYTNIRFKKFIQLMVFLPLIIPSYIISLGWVQFFGPSGMLYQFLQLFMKQPPFWNLYSMSGIIAVLGVTTYPLVYLFTVNTFRQIPHDNELASRVSGASLWQTFKRVTLPMARPGLIAGIFIAFLSCLDNFGVPAFLGTPANITVLTTYIYQQVIGFGLSSFNSAAVLSVILGIIALIGLALQWLALRRSEQIETHRISHEPRIDLKGKRIWIEALIIIFFALTTILPLFAMVLSPLVKAVGVPLTLETMTFENYAQVLQSSTTREAVKVSLTLALTTGIVCLFLGTFIGYIRVRRPNKVTKFIENAVTLPYALPGTVFALSMIFAWLQPLPGWFPGIYGTAKILYIAYITRFMILQVRSAVSAFQQLDPSIEEAAQASGTNGWGKWKKILLPIISPTLISGMILVVLSSLTELTVSSLLYSADSETIGVAILGYQQSGYTLQANAFSSLIVIVIILLYFIGTQIGKINVKIRENA